MYNANGLFFQKYTYYVTYIYGDYCVQLLQVTDNKQKRDYQPREQNQYQNISSLNTYKLPF